MISVAVKTPPEIRLGICIYKTSLLHIDPMAILVSHHVVPPTFYNEIASTTVLVYSLLICRSSTKFSL